MKRFNIMKHPHKMEYWALDVKTHKILGYSDSPVDLEELLRMYEKQEMRKDCERTLNSNVEEVL